MAEVKRTTTAVVLMDEREARQLVEWINQGVQDVSDNLLELYEREGWRALGYTSWEVCVRAEFHLSRATLYRQLRMATDRKLLETSGTKLSQNETASASNISHAPSDTQLRELHPLLIEAGPRAVDQVWSEVLTEYGPAASPAYIRAKVTPLLGPKAYVQQRGRDLYPSLRASRKDDALVLQARWQHISRFFMREWSVVPAAEVAKALKDTDLAAVAEVLVHMAEWLAAMNTIVEERRGRPTD